MSSIHNQILYEDEYVIILNKYPSQLVQSDKAGSTSLLDLIKEYLKQKGKNVFCEVVHRLDRPVSGVVLFAKTKEVLANLNLQFQNHQVTKIYWAIVAVKPTVLEGSLVDFIAKNEKLNKSYIVNADAKNAQKAELDYKLITESDRYFLLQVKLKTGRHHQIRVQLANMGCPVKGDLKYGYKRSNNDGSISLHSQKITFKHPVTKKQITVQAPVPNDKLWEFFQNSVNQSVI